MAARMPAAHGAFMGLPYTCWQNRDAWQTRLHTKWEGKRQLAPVLRSLLPVAVERVHGAGLINVHRDVKLQRQPPARTPLC